MEKEIWKDAVGYEGLYQISSLGRVKSLSRVVQHSIYGDMNISEKILKPGVNSSGYYGVNLNRNNKSNTSLIHQLVAYSFLNHKPCGHKLVVNHKDFNRLNNKLDNLEIITNRENSNQKHLESTSKYVGVSIYSRIKKWQSKIKINGKVKFLGHFEDEYEAHLAYQKELKIINNNIK